MVGEGPGFPLDHISNYQTQTYLIMLSSLSAFESQSNNSSCLVVRCANVRAAGKDGRLLFLKYLVT